MKVLRPLFTKTHAIYHSIFDRIIINKHNVCVRDKYIPSTVKEFDIS